MRISTTAASLLLQVVTTVKAVNIPRAASSGNATVDLAKDTGPTKCLASGWIYGFPDNGTQTDYSIPESFVRDVKFVASRAGGAQIPAKGWTAGLEEYIGRFNSTLSNYRTTRYYDGDFILLVHDLWGADGGSISLFPGDNSDWSQTDAFFEQVAKDLQANNMLEGLVLDLWNEPDIKGFWDRPWEQYLEYYIRSHNFFRKALPNTLISGPSMAASPKPDNQNWSKWMQTVASNKITPDIYSWHQIGAWSREPDTTVPDFNTMRASHGLPDRPIDVNEYADRPEQNPANSVYYIAQHERHNLRALRANWGSGSDLHDYLGNLVYKNSDGYYPNGEWQLYKYYAQMQGNRVASAASADLRFDVFAVRSDRAVKIIAGTRTVQASYEIKVTGLKSLGLPEKGSVSVRVLRFDWLGDQGEVGAPVDLGTNRLSYSSDTLNILMNPPNNSTAYAYELIL